MTSTAIDADAGLTAADVVEFYRDESLPLRTDEDLAGGPGSNTRARPDQCHLPEQHW